MNWKELLIYGLFTAVIIFICFHFMERKDFSAALKLTTEEQNHIFQELKKRGAEDCVITKTEDGFRCEELKTGKVFKVKM